MIQPQLLILLKTFLPLLFKLFTQKSNFQKNHSGIFCHQKSMLNMHKENAKLEVSKYRPFSLLSNIDKVFKKLMHGRLIEFLEEEQTLHYRHFAFRKDFSTNHVHLTLLESLQKAPKKRAICMWDFYRPQKSI